MDNKTLNAGDLTLEYAEGKLRYVKFGETELIRGIYFAVRDADWGTLPLRCHEEHLVLREGGFTLTFRSESTEDGQAVVSWECAIEGEANNRISFAIKGTFLREYASNRAGFCLLHPLKHTVGQAFDVRTPNGQHQSTYFPQMIAPHQPATDIVGLEWTTANGIACSLTFEGEVFEMEDQRNWTDASFKTYCTPLRYGWPKKYRRGDVVEQEIIFEMRFAQQSTSPALLVQSINYDTNFHFPWPGIGSRIPNGSLEELHGAEISKLPLDHLRADIVWGGSTWTSTLESVVSYASRCGKPLYLVLHYVQGEIPALVETLHHHCQNIVLEAISIVQKDRVTMDSALLQKVHRQIRAYFPGVKLGVGSQYLFTQFNRHRPPAQLDADFVFFGNNPQVHAFDNESIVETIEGQGETMKSAKAIAPDLPVHVSPIALNAPFSPDKLPKNQTIRETLDYDFAPDPRQGGTFVAGWVLGCLAALTAEGARHLDFFETEGARGLIIDGKATPSYTLLKRVLEQQPTHVFLSRSSDPLRFSTLGVATESGTFLYVANHRSEQLTIQARRAWCASTLLDAESIFSDFVSPDDGQVMDIPPHGILEVEIREQPKLKP